MAIKAFCVFTPRAKFSFKSSLYSVLLLSLVWVFAWASRLAFSLANWAKYSSADIDFFWAWAVKALACRSLNLLIRSNSAWEYILIGFLAKGGCSGAGEIREEFISVLASDFSLSYNSRNFQ